MSDLICEPGLKIAVSDMVTSINSKEDTIVVDAIETRVTGNEDRLDAVETGQNTGVVGYATKALMDADLAHDAGTVALVTNDPIQTNNGNYLKLLGTGVGSWQQSSFDRTAVLETSVDKLAHSASLDSILTENDLLLDASVTWAADTIITPSGGIVTVAGYYLSSLIPVYKGATIRFKGNASHSNSQNIMGINFEGDVFTELKDKVDMGAIEYLDIEIPEDIYYIRVATYSAIPTILDYRPSNTTIDQEFREKYVDPEETETLFGVNIEYPIAGGATNTSNTIYGTGYLPISVGDTIKYSLYSFNAIYGIALYDSSKVFIRFIVDNTNARDIEYEYILNDIDDVGAAYIVAGSHIGAGDYSKDFISVSSLNNIAKDLRDERKELDPMKGRNKPVLEAYSVASEVTETAGLTQCKYVTVPSYMKVISQELSSDTKPRHFTVMKIKLSALNVANTEASFSWHNVQLGYDSDTVTLALNETAIVFSLGNLIPKLTCDKADTTIEIIERMSWMVSEEFYTNLTYNDTKYIANSPRIFDKNWMLSDVSMYSNIANRLATVFDGGVLSYFGNSITHSMTPEFIKHIPMTLNACHLGGSNPQTNLTDTYLALLDPTATLVFMSTGSTGGYVASGDIASRDRATSEGAFNYALDYIHTNAPQAKVVFISPPYYQGGTNNQEWHDLFVELSNYRLVPYLDVFHNCHINAENYISTFGNIDGIHLNDAGIDRQTATVVGLVRGLSY